MEEERRGKETFYLLIRRTSGEPVPIVIVLYVMYYVFVVCLKCLNVILLFFNEKNWFERNKEYSKMEAPKQTISLVPPICFFLICKLLPYFEQKKRNKRKYMKRQKWISTTRVFTFIWFVIFCNSKVGVVTFFKQERGELESRLFRADSKQNALERDGGEIREATFVEPTEEEQRVREEVLVGEDVFEEKVNHQRMQVPLCPFSKKREKAFDSVREEL